MRAPASAWQISAKSVAGAPVPLDARPTRSLALPSIPPPRSLPGGLNSPPPPLATHSSRTVRSLAAASS
eukprot:scaffold30494_cov31-Tisochrysis_lutea.AAC.4